ncbi:MAG: dNTP triphosphohydrolase [Candidatus Peribacteraceae bacterium]|nr:dNTP triphosphohydrolase [Candidatus Peribacteraceae bacterium]
MQSLRDRLREANALLAPWAVPHEGQSGRAVKEPDDETRFPFQRDRDRIIHTQAFRRLQGKTQVFTAGKEGDHVRTRLTHTMEVAQISRDLARTLRLNEDLAECVALAHDLGHPPFGHRGEEALDAWAKGQGLAFEHNEQSVRIVTVLERHSPLASGLNLNAEVLEGMRKHREAWVDAPFSRGMTLESQIVDKADEIAYLGHDTDDGLRAGLFSLDDILTVPLVAEADALTKARGTSLRGALIHLLVSDLYAETDRRLAAHGIHTLQDVYACEKPLVGFSTVMEMKASVLQRFLHERMYMHPRVTAPSEEGQRIIRLLCERFLKEPTNNIRALQKQTGGTSAESVKDYVAGMTDAFAKEAAGGGNP